MGKKGRDGKKKEKEVKEKKKKYGNSTGDTITVLAIIGFLVLTSIILAIVTDSGTRINLPDSKMGGGASAQERQATLRFVCAMVFACIFFICLFIFKKIRDKKRKKREKQLENIRKIEELENARERVRKAKMEGFLKAGQDELEKRKKEERLLRGSGRYPQRNANGMGQPYRRRDLNQFKDEGELPEYEEEEGFFLRIWHAICNFFRKKDNED